MVRLPSFLSCCIKPRTKDEEVEAPIPKAGHASAPLAVTANEQAVKGQEITTIESVKPVLIDTNGTGTDSIKIEPDAKTTTISTASSVQYEAPAVEYKGAPLPLNEGQRYDYLCSLNVLDTQPDVRFDDLTKLCCMVFKTPIALVSLVDKDRQWFKSVQGLEVTQTDRKSSFCAWTLLPVNPEVLVVENALEDLRFHDNPLVQGFPNIRFYAGCPLVATNGLRLGSLCIIDTKPRRFDAESCNMLVNMAEMVVREIEKDMMLEHQRQRSALLSKENTQLLRAIDCFSEGIMLCNMSAAGWPIMFVNEAWEKLTTIDREEGFGKGFWDMFTIHDGDSESIIKQFSKAIQQMQNFELQVYFTNKAGVKMYLHTQFRCAGNNGVDSSVPLIGIPSIVANNGGDGPIYYFAVCSIPAVTSSQMGSGKELTPFNLIPTRKPFDDVRLGPLLGKGAFGRVYRGTWNGASVAVKVMEHLESGNEDGSVGTPLVEAGLHNQISHPNVVQTYKHDTRVASSATSDSGKTLMETWMVLEFCNRGSLSDAVERGWFRSKGAFCPANLASIISTAKEIAGAMCYLHSLGILHGDLTGNNILLSSSDKDDRGFVAKVADFGLSRVLSSGATHISTRTYGTVTHMPPELLLNGTLAKAADVFAYGVILWEMYTGKRPFQGMSHGQIIHQITSGKALQWPEGTPRGFASMVDRCFATDMNQRPTFLEVMDMMEDLAVEDL